MGCLREKGKKIKLFFQTSTQNQLFFRPEWLTDMINDGTATYIANGISGKRHIFMFGEVLEVNYKGSHFVRRFPWKKQYNEVSIRNRLNKKHHDHADQFYAIIYSWLGDL